VSMATEGLPSGGSVGYSLFDNSDNLGTSSFVQNVNLLRALEGELSRTIRNIDGVIAANVRLVLPKRQLFARERQIARASIFLKLVGNKRLSNDQVNAIQYLVSSAVANLDPANVTVVDRRGRLLSQPSTNKRTGGEAAEHQRLEMESRLTVAIQNIVEQTVGVGNVRANVVAEMDFDRTTTNAEIYDPDSQVARSTQTTEETSTETENQRDGSISVSQNLPETETDSRDSEVSSSSSVRTEETTNFEIAKTLKTTVHDAATIRKLSAAVLVNDIPKVEEDGSVTYTPRTEDDLKKIEALVKTAIGFDEERGDQVQIVAMQFAIDADTVFDNEEDLSGSSLNKADYFRIGEILALVIVAVLLVLLVLRPLVSRLMISQGSGRQANVPALEVPASAPMLPGMTQQQIMENPEIIRAVEAGDISQADLDKLIASAQTSPTGTVPEESEGIDIAMIEGRVKASSIRKIGELVDKHPEEAVAIMRSWMYQDA